MTQRGSKAGPADDRFVAIVSLLGTVIVAFGIVEASVRWGRRWDGDSTAAPWNPVAMTVGLVKGGQTWPEHGTTVAVMLAVAVAAVTVGLVVLVLHRSGGHQRAVIQRARREMATEKDLQRLTRKGQTKAGEAKLRTRELGPGLSISKSLGGLWLYSSWEDVMLDIWGARQGKTTSRAIPMMVEAPGAALGTANKADLVKYTIGPRAACGRVYLVDPQAIATTDGKPTMWWNLLSYVTDEERAERMAKQLAMSGRGPGDRADPYFDRDAERLLALLLLAAATSGRDLTAVHRWLNNPDDEAPQPALRQGGFPRQAASLTGLAGLSDKQRDGVYGTARSWCGWMGFQHMMSWVTPPADGSIPEFDPHAFVRSTNLATGYKETLYLLSKDGSSSTAGPIITALGMAVMEAGETYSEECGGRLPVPMCFVLDEAANVARIKDLEFKYSHYGSRGMPVLTILQNYAQGELVWGKDGMETLWSAATVKLYGGGVDDPNFLHRMSDLVGTYDRLTRSRSSGRGGDSFNASTQETAILTQGELREVGGKQHTGILLRPGTRAAMIRTVPWWKRKIKAAIKHGLTKSPGHLVAAQNPSPPQPAPDDPDDGIADLIQVDRSRGQVNSSSNGHDTSAAANGMENNLDTPSLTAQEVTDGDDEARSGFAGVRPLSAMQDSEHSSSSDNTEEET